MKIINHSSQKLLEVEPSDIKSNYSYNPIIFEIACVPIMSRDCTPAFSLLPLPDPLSHAQHPEPASLLLPTARDPCPHPTCRGLLLPLHRPSHSWSIFLVSSALLPWSDLLVEHLLTCHLQCFHTCRLTAHSSEQS